MLLSRGGVWGLISSCGVSVGSFLVAVCGLLSSCGGGPLLSFIGRLCIPLEVRWGLHLSFDRVAPL